MGPDSTVSLKPIHNPSTSLAARLLTQIGSQVCYAHVSLTAEKSSQRQTREPNPRAGMLSEQHATHRWAGPNARMTHSRPQASRHNTRNLNLAQILGGVSGAKTVQAVHHARDFRNLASNAIEGATAWLPTPTVACAGKACTTSRATARIENQQSSLVSLLREPLDQSETRGQSERRGLTCG
jgi:hypothetical protein